MKVNGTAVTASNQLILEIIPNKYLLKSQEKLAIRLQCQILQRLLLVRRTLRTAQHINQF
jgi:hypothetical protein